MDEALIKESHLRRNNASCFSKSYYNEAACSSSLHIFHLGILGGLWTTFAGQKSGIIRIISLNYKTDTLSIHFFPPEAPSDKVHISLSMCFALPGIQGLSANVLELPRGSAFLEDTIYDLILAYLILKRQVVLGCSYWMRSPLLEALQEALGHLISTVQTRSIPDKNSGYQLC